jgi:DNA-binding MarR family transcriptional regulator
MTQTTHAQAPLQKRGTRAKQTSPSSKPRQRAVTGRLDGFALDQFLPYRFAVLAGAMSADLARTYAAQFDVGIAEWRIIANLGHFGTMTAGDLAMRSTLDKPAVTRALQRLAGNGIIVRTVPDLDRRQARLSLTTRGRALHTQISALARRWENHLLAPISRQDRRALDKVLARLQARLTDTMTIQATRSRQKIGRP